MGTELEIIQEEEIASRIYYIRGRKVMLDRDLAQLYDVETRTLNQAVRRNIDLFPSDFMVSLTREEINKLSQAVITSKIKHAPNVFAFSEQGVAMLSCVLKSKKARLVNIQIIRTFTKLRELLNTHKDLHEKIERLERKNDQQFRVVFEAIKHILTPPEKPKQIGFIHRPKKTEKN